MMAHWEIVNDIIFPILSYNRSVLDLSSKKVQTTACRWGWQLCF